MAKDIITEYDSTANNNTVCGDVNIAENSALPSDMNNFAREIMSHLKEGLGSGTPLYVDQTNNRVGINKTPTVALDVSGDANLSGTLDIERSSNDTGGIKVQNTNNSQGSAVAQVEISGGDNAYANLLLECNSTNHSIRQDGSGNLKFINATTERMRITSAGNVGINETNPATKLAVSGSIAGTGALNISGGGWGIQPYVANSLLIDNNSGETRLFATGANATTDGSFLFYTSQTDGGANERMRITSAGFSKHTNFGTYRGSTGEYHEFNSNDAGDATLVTQNINGSYTGDIYQAVAHRSASSAYRFLRCFSGNASDVEAFIAGDGNAYADGSWNGGGADYAEYFEWADGNTDNEDRRGYTVVLDNNKIRKATSDDNASVIIGVISGNPSMVGDSDVEQWKHKYQRDDYGTYIFDDNDERVLNTEYDENQEYVSRRNRQEWDTVGLMGKLRIRKNQPTGSNWIKMRDVSETVEEWLVR